MPQSHALYDFVAVLYFDARFYHIVLRILTTGHIGSLITGLLRKNLMQKVERKNWNLLVKNSKFE